MGETAPLPEPTPPVPVEPPLAPAAKLERRVAHDQGRRSSAALDPHRPVGLDRRTWLRLKRGQVAIEQTLDLHGRTQDEAHGALARFLAAARAAGCRCVLVVTGKGLGSGGTLRHMVPRWLNEGPIASTSWRSAPPRRAMAAPARFMSCCAANASAERIGRAGRPGRARPFTRRSASFDSLQITA